MKSKLFIALASAVCFNAAFAQEYSELDKLRTENAMLTERLKNVDLKSKIASGGSDAAKSNASVGSQSAPSYYPSRVDNAKPDDRELQVTMVSGVKGNLTATLQLPSGGTVNVHNGSSVPGVGVVKSISVNEVVIEGKKGSVSVPVMSDSNQPKDVPSSTSVTKNVMPPLPLSMINNRSE